MKMLKLICAVLLLGSFQVAVAADADGVATSSHATPAQLKALDAALAAVKKDPENQALVEAAVQAAANANVPASEVVTALRTLGVPATIVAAAIVANINKGEQAAGKQPSCAPSCEKVTGNVSYTKDIVPAVNKALAQTGSTVGIVGDTTGNTTGTVGTGTIVTPVSVVSPA